jgi:c-di-GMP-binding flagellar brake protein YcgR
MKERREFVRLDMNVKVDWKQIYEASDITIEASDKTKNISAGGICLVVYEKLKKGDKLNIDMELPSRKIINARGKIVWINEYEIFGRELEKVYDMGVEFTQIRNEEREEINKFVFA